ncbi:hypothetical protein [Marichromatium bheemlicum]|uniref:Uncharacterized protein n=1 Tax=Marichromatium bheemlicum TaxID=365339 RepID=A0ABX1I6A0_9GAMM|nr:hypothetical protein [Marichromatium bheemlicum]NKN31686.1 hypothetical protein [Marichromatium bheemlicum]
MMGDDGLSAAGRDTETGFLDVAANALAVMILATMLLVVVAAPLRLPGDTPPDTHEARLRFPTDSDPVMRPLYRYFLVSDAGVVAIDLDGLARACMAAAGDARTAQGQMGLIVDRRARRDWNHYRASLRPDYAVLKAQSRQLDVEELAAFVATLGEDYARARVSPTFLVLPDGLATVAPIYWALREAGTPVRWFAARYEAAIPFEHSARVFELPGALD